MTTASRSIVQVSVSLTSQGQGYTSVRRISLHDKWGDERPEAQIAAEALARGVRAVYGRRAYWVRDHGTSSGLSPSTAEQIDEYGTILLELTQREQQHGYANVIADRVHASVVIL